MSTLEKAIIIATKAHEGVIDKGGNPYILHPLRVMIKQTSEECRIVAVLHDVVEDTDISLTDLRNEGFSEDIILAVDALTRRSNESYMEFISRCKQDAMARLVKLADIEDNSDMSRIKNPTQRDYNRLQKYKKAKDELLS